MRSYLPKYPTLARHAPSFQAVVEPQLRATKVVLPLLYFVTQPPNNLHLATLPFLYLIGYPKL